MTKKPFDEIKKNLPNNYAKLVVELIDFEENKAFVYDVVRGRRKESERTIKVWKALKQVERKHIKILKKAAEIKSQRVAV